MLEIILFLSSVFVVSISGAMAPGPVTATIITLGIRKKYAGTFMAIGHGIIEVPLFLLVVFGPGKLLNTPSAKITIGVIGGLVLLWMGRMMFKDVRTASLQACNNVKFKSPVLAGIILSASNPYFLIWWITIGMDLATDAIEFNKLVLALFIIVHWSVDLIWFQALSFASNKGAEIMSEKHLRTVLSICAFALIAFGIYFIYDAARIIW
ncbi:MAG: LysE family translocator [Phycisphaerae bacterium]|nr:LysE family translocator [Phycisphaerae bacterium]